MWGGSVWWTPEEELTAIRSDVRAVVMESAEPIGCGHSHPLGLDFDPD